MRQSRRVFEWGLLSLVILLLVVVLLQQGQKVQGQAELAAIKTTLGALRTAAMMDDLQARVRGKTGNASTNPFDLLQTRPANYLGHLGRAQALNARPGSWWFEPDCTCVGYAPLEPRWVSGAVVDSGLRFRVVVGVGPLQLTAMEPYLWQGQRLD